MTLKCNGCGGDFGIEWLAATFTYGNVSVEENQRPTASRADYHKTLCPRCYHVLKDILLRSDLSEHWEKYDWSLQGEMYVEGYDE